MPSGPQYTKWLPFLLDIARLEDLEPNDAATMNPAKSLNAVQQVMSRMLKDGLLTRTYRGAYLVNNQAVQERIREIRDYEAKTQDRLANACIERRDPRAPKPTPAYLRAWSEMVDIERREFCAKMRANMDRGRM